MCILLKQPWFLPDLGGTLLHSFSNIVNTRTRGVCTIFTKPPCQLWEMKAGLTCCFYHGRSTLVRRREGQSGTCQWGEQNMIQTQKWLRRNQRAKPRPEAALTFISSMGIIQVSFPNWEQLRRTVFLAPEFRTRRKDEATILVLFNTKFSFIERQTNKRPWTMNLSCRCQPSCLFLASFRRQCRVVTAITAIIYCFQKATGQSTNDFESGEKALYYGSEKSEFTGIILNILTGWCRVYCLISVFHLVSLMCTFCEWNHILQRCALPFACLKILWFHRSGSTLWWGGSTWHHLLTIVFWSDTISVRNHSPLQSGGAETACVAPRRRLWHCGCGLMKSRLAGCQSGGWALLSWWRSLDT